ncbi:MAG: DMT family transporter [Bacillota bacterium]|jgi:multidrug transporter EmrE-like cation transporter
MEWLFLIIAGCCEVVGVSNFKLFSDHKKPKNFLITVLAFVVGFMMLWLAMRTIPASVAYAIWTGIGGAGSVLMGAFFFKEGITVLKLLFVTMIITGVIGLKLFAA